MALFKLNCHMVRWPNFLLYLGGPNWTNQNDVNILAILFWYFSSVAMLLLPIFRSQFQRQFVLPAKKIIPALSIPGIRPNSGQTFEMKKNRLLVTRTEDDIPRPAVEMLKKQLRIRLVLEILISAMDSGKRLPVTKVVISFNALQCLCDLCNDQNNKQTL